MSSGSDSVMSLTNRKYPPSQAAGQKARSNSSRRSLPLMDPAVVEARRAVENLEREIIFGAIRSYKFYQSIKDTVCPFDPEKNSHRQDFSTERYNFLWRFIAAFYQRFNTIALVKDTFIPNPVMAAYVIDTFNGQGVPESIANKLMEEINEETEFTNSLTFESLNAFAQSKAFSDWLSTRILDQTTSMIAAQKNLGMLTLDNLEAMVAKAKQSTSNLSHGGNNFARSIGEFEIPKEDDLDWLIGPNRFLCYEAIATLVGPSGIGKSTLAMQMAICFSLGREIFGFKPRTSLRILIIQGENDDGDIAEMRDGTVAGLGLSDEEKATVNANVFCCRCNSATGQQFIQGVVRSNLQQIKPDLLIIDPALCYVGGDTKEQRVVGEFLRTFLLPELQRFKCACLLLHHTNKPPTQNPKGGSTNEDAYAESGSAEFRNVSRAAITLKPIGDGSVFELRVPKRGTRLGWVDDSGQPTTRKYIRHSADRKRLFWEVASDDDALKAKATAQEDKTEAFVQRVLECIVKHSEISQNNLLAEAKVAGVGDKACRDAIKVLLGTSKIICSEKPRTGARPEKFYSPKMTFSIPGGEQ